MNTPPLSWWKEVKETFLLFLPSIYYSFSHLLRFFSVVGLLASEILVAAWVPYLGKRFVETVSGDIRLGIFVTLSFWSLLWLLEKLIRPVQDLLFFPVINQTIRDLSYRVIEKIHTLPWEFSKKERVGEVISRMKRISQSARFFFRTCCLGFLPIFGKLCILSYFLLWQPFYGIGVGICLFLYLWIMKRGCVRYLQTRDFAWRATDEVTEHIYHSVSNAHIARFFRSSEMEKIGRELDKEAEAWLVTNRAQNGFQIQIGAILTFSLLILSGLGVFLVQYGKMSVGDFVWIQGQCVALFLPMKLLSIEWRQFQESVIDIKKVREMLTQTDPQIFSSSCPSLQPVPLRFEHMRFAYPGGPVLFDRVCLEIAAGEKISLTGPSGIGKTTCAYLMTGMFFPQEGEVFLFGRSTRFWEAEAIRSQVQHVSLKGGIFPGSFHSNLLYGAQVDEERVWEVIRQVGLAEVIGKGRGLFQEVPLGDLSQGERVRILLARAMLSPPKILLLDEVLQAVEPQEELRLLTLVATCVPTIVQISHRLPDPRFFTRHFAMQEGGTLCEVQTPLFSGC